MSQQTLGIVSTQIKNQFLREIYKYQVVTERQFDLSVEAAQQIFKLDIKEQQAVYGFILEGPNAIEDWYTVVTRSAARSKRFIIHGSSNPDNARRETDWFQNLLLSDLSVPNTGSSFSASSTKSSNNKPIVNIKKKVIGNPATKSTNSGTQQQQKKTSLVRSTTPPTTMTTNSTTKATISTTKTSRTTSSTPTKKPSTRSKIPSVKPPLFNANTTEKKSNMTTTTRTNQKSVTPINKRSSEATHTTTGTTRRGSLVTSSLPVSASKKLLSITSKGGVSKNTPPVSIITGRTRKPSRLTEKRPVTAASTTMAKNKVQPIAIKEVPAKEEEPVSVTDKEKVPEEQELDEEEIEATAIEQVQEVKKESQAIAQVQEEKQESPVIEEQEPEKEIEMEQEAIIRDGEDQEFINEPPPPVSHPSTCSSAATDEHDAEVAAATQKRPIVDSIAVTNSGRSSFSPNSIASLPRPETPEVDQLRLKFETIIQTPVETQMMRRPSKISPEFVSRIKEMKPRGPVGTRVKSMVELFMDENLNKWEF